MAGNSSPYKNPNNLSDDSLENMLTGILQKGCNSDGECTSKEGLKKACLHNSPNNDSPVSYLDREIFPVLLPCFEDMLFAAHKNNVLKIQKSRFNGLDYLAELLWNRNPLHPERQLKPPTPIFDIPFVVHHLKNNPRPVFPKSWLWSEEEAAVVIQAGVRGYFVRRSPEVQELRQFWKALAEEKISQDIDCRKSTK